LRRWHGAGSARCVKGRGTRSSRVPVANRSQFRVTAKSAAAPHARLRDRRGWIGTIFSAKYHEGLPRQRRARRKMVLRHRNGGPQRLYTGPLLGRDRREHTRGGGPPAW